MLPDVIIRKQSFRISTTNTDTAMTVRKALNNDLQYALVGMYEELFKNINDDIYIEKISINAGVCNPDEIGERVLMTIREEIFQKINEKKQVIPFFNEHKNSVGRTKPENTSRSFSQDSVSVLFYFLQKGSFPWWFINKQRKTAAQLLNELDTSSLETLLIKILRSNKTEGSVSSERIRKRFLQLVQINNFPAIISLLIQTESDQLMRANLSAIYNKSLKKYVCDVLLTNSNVYEFSFISFLFTYREKEVKNIIRYFLQELKAALNHQLPGNNYQANPGFEELKRDDSLPTDIVFELQNELTKNEAVVNDIFNTKEEDRLINDKDYLEKERESSRKLKADKVVNEMDDEKATYIDNSGIVILHPFLPHLFSHLELLDENGLFKNAACRNKAIVLLVYLQASNDEYCEEELVLNKVLCGMSIEEVFTLNMKLTSSEKKECDELLLSVITHWEALKGSGIEAMQQSFFARKGKLSFKEDHWLLQIERNAMDILIDRLPWGYGIVKLPWLKSLIHVEW